jgi:hypothetical protein
MDLNDFFIRKKIQSPNHNDRYVYPKILLLRGPVILTTSRRAYDRAKISVHVYDHRRPHVIVDVLSSYDGH